MTALAVDIEDEIIIFQADDVKERAPGIDVGDMMPHDLDIPDHRGRMRSFDELKGRNGLVLYFLRSAIWSPYCRFQLRDITERGSLIEDAGYNIAVLSYDSIRKLSIFSKEEQFPYPMLSDKGSVVIQSFGLLNEEYEPGTTYYGVPYPAVYIIGHDGVILRKFYTPDPKKRPDVEAVYEEITTIGEYKPVVEYHEEFDR